MFGELMSKMSVKDWIATYEAAFRKSQVKRNNSFGTEKAYSIPHQCLPWLRMCKAGRRQIIINALSCQTKANSK
ncbi:MAG: hypothetical protein WKF59_22490 [Chitinophagaceae bacterium]